MFRLKETILLQDITLLQEGPHYKKESYCKGKSHQEKESYCKRESYYRFYCKIESDYQQESYYKRSLQYRK